MTDLTKGKVCGAVTVGERGQIVIPSELRKRFKVNAGDKMIVYAKPGGTIVLIPAQEFNQLLNDAAGVMAKFNK
jgi:AbrB family looped-hinge helix DNA binding protein